MRLPRFCTRSLLRESLDYSLIDRIPGRQTDRKTLLGELNWIFTAVTDTIAWNVLPHGIYYNTLIMPLDLYSGGWKMKGVLDFILCRFIPEII